jgi:outer membrane receptor protein involved in Fe transport
MMKHLLSLASLLLAAGFLFAQNTAKEVAIIGQIVDSVSREAVPFATVKIFDERELKKVVAVGATDSNGKFAIALKTGAGSYVLLCDLLGKSTVKISVKVEDKSVNVGKILMADNAQNLGEVSVTAQRSLVKVDLDKITYDMKEDPDAKTNNVLEMLKKVPMVSVDGSDNVQLKGSSSFKYYINGKPSTMLANSPSEVLKSLPANTVKSIEVITDPGAKYDAEGVTGIINIVTESALAGYTVSLRANGQMRGTDGLGGGAGTFFSLKYGKLGVTGNFNYGRYNNPPYASHTSRENFVSPDFRILTQEGSGKGLTQNLYGYGEVSYELDTLNLINVNFSRWDWNNESSDLQKMLMQNDNRDDVYKYDQSTDNKGGRSGISAGADYQHSFATANRLLTASYSLSAYNNNSDALSQIENAFGYAQSSNQQFNDADSYEHTFQLDFTTPVKTIHNVELGAKYIKRINQSESGTEMLMPDNTWNKIASYNDDFEHLQDIVGAYAGYSMKYQKWGVKTGVRYEATWLNARYALDGAHNFGASYQNLVPSATLTFMPTQAHNLRLGYNLRIMRPGIYQLNPYVNSTDSNYISQGNPNLDAVKYHNVSLNYNMFQTKLNVNLSLSYNFSNNGVTNFTTMQGSRSYTTYLNIAREQSLGLSGYVSYTPTTTLRMNANLWYSYSDMRANNNSGLHSSGFSGFGYGDVQYTTPLWDLILGVTADLFVPGIGLQTVENSARYSYGFSLTKNLLDKRINIRLRTGNPFTPTTTYRSIQESLDYRSVSENTYPSRSFGLSVSYRFGEMKEQIKKAQRRINNDDSMDGNENSGES